MGYANVPDEWNRLTQVTDIGYGEIILLARINSMSDNEYGACYMSNERLASMLGTSERTIKRWIKRLVDLGLVKKQIDPVTSTRYLTIKLKKICELLS